LHHGNAVAADGGRAARCRDRDILIWPQMHTDETQILNRQDAKF
jgi:hypothetical protein